MPTLILKLMNRAAPAGAVALAMLGTAGCIGEAYADPAYYPSEAYMATEDPVYYDGQANYFYDGLWYYRSGRGWGYYRSEPGYLRQYRFAHPALGRGRARGARGGVRRVGGGGSRGGGFSSGGSHGGGGHR